MTLKQSREKFEQGKVIYESARLIFEGIDGYDVYNCSVPFKYNEKYYLYGRVEKPEDWARSRTMLFENTGKDKWTRVINSMIYQMEDPNIAFVDKKIVLGGVFVYYNKGKGSAIKNLFYRGTDLEDMYFFTMGPKGMKDIRLIQLPSGKIGVFSRPRRYNGVALSNSSSDIGFAIIDSLDQLCANTIEAASNIPGIFSAGEWGGPNQAYYLESGNIGIIGHKCYNTMDNAGVALSTYLTVSSIFNIEKHRIIEEKIIATRNCFPDYRAKKLHIADCTFPSGIVMREDGKCDLYCGISDSAEGRIVIDYPFEGFGKIVQL